MAINSTGGGEDEKFRIVISKIQRIEILIDAESEDQAVEKARELYEAGRGYIPKHQK